MLVDMGYDFDRIFNLAGGFEAWKAANGPIEII
jgi:rhodanese-related sulfurtransferase